MRKIISRDVFKLARIMRAADVKADLVKLLDTDTEEITDAQGLDLIMTVIFACSTERQEEAIYDLLGGILEKDPEEVASQSLDALKEDLKKIANDNNLLVFFRQAQTLIPQKG